ncbi:protein odr-4 homolog isoform X1 [Durio zibethinus]|uniref:Protein odr-4 homolog isoform X1 n=1 Tax=Durio zibethinus TaxID=66656 RepID=A0A6P5XFM0_DURZI|nr:protein odr-4 homolog isoform X1 [Durio zibethinus]
MVKAVVGEETQLQLAEDRLSQSSLPAQVGLVIGKLSSILDRGFVFDLVPTPQNDAGEPACSVLEPAKDNRKKGSKAKSRTSDSSSSLVIDKDWVAEHARQVSRMMVGGMKVVGIYVWASEAAFKNSTMVLCQTVKGVAEAASFSEDDLDERLLIHICYSPRRWTCRNCKLSSNITSSSLRPCDFKMGRVLTSLQTFKCFYNFDLRLPIYQEKTSKSQTLSDVLHNGISIYAKELRGAKAIMDGNLVVNDGICTTDGLHEVELLLPFMRDIYIEACSQKDVVGVVNFTGSVCSFAFLNSKEPISQAIADIKDDIIRSLQSRLDIICDETDEDLGPTDNGIREASNDSSSEKPVSQLVLNSLRKNCNLSLPGRVFVPWLAGTFISDYIQSSETLEVLKDHCVELMSMEAPSDASTILEPEEEALRVTTGSFWDVVVPYTSATNSSQEKNREITSTESSQKTINSTNVNFIAAVFFLLLSVLAGYMLVRKS